MLSLQLPKEKITVKMAIVKHEFETFILQIKSYFVYKYYS